jgi:uncharacterized protein (TIGR02722 family)
MNKMVKVSALLGSIVLAASLSACSSSPTVSYTDPNAVDTTSVDFSSTDLQTTTAKMVDSMLSSPQVLKLTANNQPVLFIGGITNNTSDIIDTTAITNAISTRLIQSGQFQFVDMSQVNAVKAQLQYQHDSGMVDPKTAVAIGQQIGAQFMFYGDISSIVAQNSSQQSVYYQVTMKLLNIRTNVIVWQAEQQIRKVAKQKTFGF